MAQRRSLPTAIVVCLVVFLAAGSSPAGIIPFITGTSSASLVTDPGPYYEWYLYELELSWSLGQGLSHWDMILKAGCADDDHLIEFPAPAGFSTSETEPNNPMAISWTGYFVRTGDPSATPPILEPVVKYNNPTGEPGSKGYGTFYFYSNIIPEYGVYPGALIAKAGQTTTTGTLTGAYPSCEVPEPAAAVVLLIGGVGLLSRRRRR